MSSWFWFKVGTVRVLYGSNHLDSSLLLPFQSGDLVTTRGRVLYRAPARVVGRRLDLLGFTLARASQAYASNVAAAKAESPAYRWPSTLGAWKKSVRATAARLERLDPAGLSPTPEHDVWESHLLGFPSGELWTIVRALVDVDRQATVSLDLTDLAHGGYLAADGSDLVPSAEREPLIILTEGKSDARLLRAAIDRLYPEYAEFIRFVDYDFARTKGGAPEAVRFVKMFCNAGIKNRIVALFDNDAAGHEACAELTGLPKNVFPMCLPPLKRFARYPTLGPDGPGFGDVDGRACSLELYLGREALKEEPVEWRGFNDKMGRYQGAVRDKAEVQKRFEALLAKKRRFDGSGIRAIVEAIFTALTK